MSDLSELEVIDRLQTSLRESIQAAEILAVSPKKGPTYGKLREHLKLVEGSVRQLSVFRQDTRWLDIGRNVEKCHQMAKEWIAGIKDPMTGRRIYISQASQFKRFSMLAATLKGIYALAEHWRTTRTGRIGMILPDMPTATRRIGAPVQVALPEGMTHKGGLIVPRRLAS